MGADQFVETLRSWRGLYKAALFETDESTLPLRIEEARKHWSFDPENCLQLLPIMTAKWRRSRMHSVLSTPWRTVGNRTQRIAGTPREPLRVSAHTFLMERYLHDSQVEN